MQFYLFKELQQNKIISREDVFNFFKNNNVINGNSLQKDSSRTLQIVNDEHRLSPTYFINRNVGKNKSLLVSNESCAFSNQILDLSETKDIVIKDFNNILFVNTVVYGNVIIQADPKYRGFDKVSIHFDHSIIFGRIDIRCHSNENTEVSFYKCTADALSFGGTDCFEGVEIDYSSFGLVEFSSAFKRISCYGSLIESLRIDDAIINDRKFTANKINWKNSLDLDKKDFSWEKIYTESLQQQENENEACENKIKRSTIQFFKTISDDFSFEDYINIQIEEQNIDGNYVSKFMSRLARLLAQPWKISLTMLGVILFFSILFYLFEPNFSLLCAFYHSTITFTTIGYSDNTTTVVSKILSIIEGFGGVCCSGAFLIALTRRYLDRKS